METTQKQKDSDVMFIELSSHDGKSENRFGFRYFMRFESGQYLNKSRQRTEILAYVATELQAF